MLWKTTLANHIFSWAQFSFSHCLLLNDQHIIYLWFDQDLSDLFFFHILILTALLSIKFFFPFVIYSDTELPYHHSDKSISNALAKVSWTDATYTDGP